MDRDRLTITLRKDILRKVDSFIDGTTIRNRSHAIETLISRSIAPKIDTAVILAGGEGIKLRPVTYEIPKSLIPISGKPLVEYTVEMLKRADIRNIIFAIGHLGDKIRDHFGDGSKFGVRITYKEESKRLGTAGALKSSASDINGTFLTIHGDVLSHINLFDLLQFHKDQATVATMALTTTDDIQSHGNVRLQGTKILEFQEKPNKGKAFSYLVNAGIYVFEPSIFTYIPKSGESYLEEDIFPKLTQKQELSGFTFDGAWFDITTHESYEKALKNWKP
ncbi:NTP transferase domain-containing protein [Candidatus Gottesmanbacteria bacterium]|nr:NTP transferase domain-containing protein [Candidatus Gottesmanbacteria bacterium]